MPLHSPHHIETDPLVRVRCFFRMVFSSQGLRHIFTLLSFFGMGVSCVDVSGQNILSLTSSDGMNIVAQAGICEINIPDEGYIYYDPDLIFVQALVSDSSDVVKVDFYMDSLHLGTDYEAPFRNMKLFNSPMGPYDLMAVATYYNGATATSTPVHIFIRCVREDLDNNGRVNINDFLILLGSFGIQCTGCHEDLTQDGAVNTFDYLRFLGALGIRCE